MIHYEMPGSYDYKMTQTPETDERKKCVMCRNFTDESACNCPQDVTCAECGVDVVYDFEIVNGGVCECGLKWQTIKFLNGRK